MKSLVIGFVLLFSSAAAYAQFRTGAAVTPGRIDSTQSKLDARSDSSIRPTRHRRTLGFLENDVAFGGTVGTPGALNFIAEGYYHFVGLRLTAGAIPIIGFVTIAGYQVDLCFVLARSADALFEWSAVYSGTYTSSFDAPMGRWTSGIGGAFGVNSNGFFLEAGIGHTHTADFDAGMNYSDPGFINALPMIVQIGYVH